MASHLSARSQNDHCSSSGCCAGGLLWLCNAGLAARLSSSSMSPRLVDAAAVMVCEAARRVLHAPACALYSFFAPYRFQTGTALPCTATEPFWPCPRAKGIHPASVLQESIDCTW